jgi:hypothetical protein
MTLSMHALAIGVPSRAFASQPPTGVHVVGSVRRVAHRGLTSGSDTVAMPSGRTKNMGKSLLAITER